MCAGLTEKVNEEEYVQVCDRASKLSPQPVTLLTALLHTDDDVKYFSFGFCCASNVTGEV